MKCPTVFDPRDFDSRIHLQWIPGVFQVAVVDKFTSFAMALISHVSCVINSASCCIQQMHMHGDGFLPLKDDATHTVESKEFAPAHPGNAPTARQLSPR